MIPVHVREGVRRYLVVRHEAGHWGFPKGHPHKGESARQTALRELAEETGVTDCRLLDAGPIVERYRYTKRRGRVVDKMVTYFLGVVEDDRITPQAGEIRECEWGDADAIAARLTFDEGRALLARAEAYFMSRRA